MPTHLGRGASRTRIEPSGREQLRVTLCVDNLEFIPMKHLVPRSVNTCRAWSWLASTVVIVCATGQLLADPASTDTARRRPNVVILLADDLGYGELGC